MTSALQQYPQLKETFERLNELGEGSFGRVYLAERHPPANENTNQANSIQKAEVQTSKTAMVGETRFMAVKKLKPYIRKKNLSTAGMKIEEYPQVEVMRGLSHPNVMSIRQILQEDKGYETAHYLLLDLGVGLMELTRHKEVAPSFEQIRCIIAQIVEGLDHIHSQGYMHRDVKPSNIYLMTDGTAKIGDFSISRKTASPSPTQEDEEKTGNVTTRFYRAPQIIYGSRHYDKSIDIWGLGCTIAELILHQTLFPGSSDINQLELIFSVLGCPECWPEAEELPYYLQFDNSKQPSGLQNLIPNMPPVFIDFLSRCLTLNPGKRATSRELKQHPLLKDIGGSVRQQLGKICGYLHEKTLKNMYLKLH